ncbi:hypothetical protein Taro_037670 [Colocasia esculenta]|uniref:Uncharacterized protein n=1 Tax=Colocasia esculenta TaxID=4460 RepID=A0A843WJY8_COLES|nr:hypothetical protein [Colocasia esculenta]
MAKRMIPHLDTCCTGDKLTLLDRQITAMSTQVTVVSTQFTVVLTQSRGGVDTKTVKTRESVVSTQSRGVSTLVLFSENSQKERRRGR